MSVVDNNENFLAMKKSYYSRFQVHFRRRRQCLTDYQQRARLLTQRKDNYNAPKYRLVVRKTNKKIICQIIRGEICGDHVVCAAYSSELSRYGVPAGHANYAAAYCTGLLVARRLLTKIGAQQKKDLAGQFKGEANPGAFTYYSMKEIEKDDDGNIVARSNKEDGALVCFLDIGLNRSTTGAVVFGALKGAADGGLFIPYSGQRLAAGYWDAEKDEPADEQALKDRVYGKHVADYMEKMQKEDPEKYKKHFSDYIKNGVKPGDLEAIYKKAHEQIRANPAPAGGAKPTPKKKNVSKDLRKKYNARRATTEAQRKAEKEAIAARKAKLTGKAFVLSQLKK